MSSDSKFVLAEDLVDLKLDETQPYLKHIELVKYTPNHFGFDRWTRMFVIPDYWMRKIYRDDIWKDTEVVKEDKVEKLTKEQKRLLNDWLMFESPFNQTIEPKLKSRTNKPDIEDAKEFLDKQSDMDLMTDCDTVSRNRDDIDQVVKRGIIHKYSSGMRIKTKKIRLKNGIAKHSGHHIQTESEIVKRALDKMNHLSPDKERECQTLFNDEGFMQMLSDQVQKYLQARGIPLS